MWRRDEPRSGARKSKSVIATQSHESFYCRDVSVAIPWNGTVKGGPPSMDSQSKRHSKRSSIPTTQTSASCSSPTKEDGIGNSKRHLPPLPQESPPREESPAPTNNNRKLPPLPKKKNSTKRSKKSKKASTSLEEDPSQIFRTDSSIGESFASNSSSIRYGDSASISNLTTPSFSWSSPSPWFESGSNSSSVQSSAWGLLIVTASLDGEIRAYQNFGIPKRLGRQATLL